METNIIEILDIGFACLIEKLGVINAEEFIAAVKRDNFDYTDWQRSYFDRMADGVFMQAAADYALEHEHTGNGKPVSRDF